jgi:NitT/TauT family transport system ATP-binding protein
MLSSKEISKEEATPPLASVRSSVITLSDVYFSFSKARRPIVEVLGGISFEVKDREFLTVMGPSGCGKSTLLNTIAGFEQPTRGQVSYRGVKIVAPGAERGVVFQSPALYPWMTVLDNVLFGPMATGRIEGARERAMSLLNEVGLRGFEHHHPHELSGGMQHRAAIARTLVNEPDVLLMDEPFAALDSQTREEMQLLLLELQERHRSTVVFVTHDIEEALLLADRTIVLSRRPTKVQEIIDVNIPRPRDSTLVLEPEFIELRKRVRSLVSSNTETK